VFLAVPIAAASALPSFLAGALAPEIHEDFGVTVSQLGFGTGAFFLAASVASLPLGRLSDRVGPVAVLRVAALASALAMVAIAGLADSFAVFVGCLIVAGLACGVTQPALNAFVADAVPHGSQGLAFGLKQASIPSAAILAGASVPLLALTVGWRWAYVAGAVMAITGPPLLRRQESRARPRAGARHSRAVLLLGAAAALGGMGPNALGVFFVTAAVREGVEVSVAGLLLALGSVLCIAARVGAGWLADRLETSGLGPALALIAVGVLGFVMLTAGSGALFVAGSMLVFAAGWGWTGLVNLAVVRRIPNAPASSTAVTQIGIYIGAGAGPAAFGLISTLSLAFAWAVMGGCAVVAGALIEAVRRMSASAPPGVTPLGLS